MSASKPFRYSLPLLRRGGRRVGELIDFLLGARPLKDVLEGNDFEREAAQRLTRPSSAFYPRFAEATCAGIDGEYTDREREEKKTENGWSERSDSSSPSHGVYSDQRRPRSDSKSMRYLKVVNGRQQLLVVEGLHDFRNLWRFEPCPLRRIPRIADYAGGWGWGWG